jgi:hypothetical protein
MNRRVHRRLDLLGFGRAQAVPVHAYHTFASTITFESSDPDLNIPNVPISGLHQWFGVFLIYIILFLSQIMYIQNRFC